MRGAKANFFAALITLCGLLSQLVVVAAHGQTDWKKEWEKTLAAAKSEGQITVYASTYERVLEAFKTEYPEIKVTSDRREILRRSRKSRRGTKGRKISRRRGRSWLEHRFQRTLSREGPGSNQTYFYLARGPRSLEMVRRRVSIRRSRTSVCFRVPFQSQLGIRLQQQIDKS